MLLQVNKVLDFIDYHGTTLQNGNFDDAWDFFLLKGTHKQFSHLTADPKGLSDLIRLVTPTVPTRWDSCWFFLRSVTYIVPVLPAPSGIMWWLPQWALPCVYDHQNNHDKEGRNCCIAEFLAPHIISQNWAGIKCKKILSVCAAAVHYYSRYSCLFIFLCSPLTKLMTWKQKFLTQYQFALLVLALLTTHPLWRPLLKSHV